MICLGVDTLSRGDCSEGILVCIFLNLVPLHLSATDRSNNLLDWIASLWSDNKKMVHLKSEKWCDFFSEDGSCLWTPPPRWS